MNVFVSAVFFGGVPGRILEAWRDGRLQMVLSAAILDEYQRVGQVLSAQYGSVDLEPILALVTVEAEIIEAPALPVPVSTDPDDDKFLALRRRCRSRRDRLGRQGPCRSRRLARRSGPAPAPVR